MASKERNSYIDIMKGILIILVVFGHLPFFEYNSRTLTLVYSFHMHAFVIIGGYLSHINKDTKLSTIILKRIKSSLIPYFLYYLITFIIIPTTHDQMIRAILVVIKGIGIPPDNALNLPLWFLTYYFSVITLYEVLQYISFKINKYVYKKNILKKEYKYFVDITTLIFIIIIMTISFRYARVYKLVRLPYNIEIAGFSLLFVFIGNMLKKYLTPHFEISKMHSRKNVIILSISTLLVLVLWYILSMKNGRIDLNARDYKNAFLMYINAILGFILLSISTFFIDKLPEISNSLLNIFIGDNVSYIKNNKVLTNNKFTTNLVKIVTTISLKIKILFCFLGENSIYILAFHIPSTFYRNAFIIPFLPISLQQMLFHNSIPSIILLTSFGIIFSIIMSRIIKRLKFIIITIINDVHKK